MDPQPGQPNQAPVPPQQGQGQQAVQPNQTTVPSNKEQDYLLEYVEKELNDGYSEAQIRKACQNSGYKEHQIDEVIQKVEIALNTKPKKPHEKPKKPKFYIDVLHYALIFIFFFVIFTSIKVYYFEGQTPLLFEQILNPVEPNPCEGLDRSDLEQCARQSAIDDYYPNHCNLLPPFEKNACLTDYASETNDFSACADVQDKAPCYILIATETNDESVCDNLEEQRDKDNCLYNIAISYSRPELCKQIIDPFYNDECTSYTDNIF
ncbi:hypothetical protein ACFLQI_01890 [Candidatus Undinarchaeota archaeon]